MATIETFLEKLNNDYLGKVDEICAEDALNNCKLAAKAHAEMLANEPIKKDLLKNE